MLKNTCIDYKFANGDKVELTLAFYALYQLKVKDEKMYKEANRIMTKGAEDIFDMITLLYVAYKCANLSNLDACIGYEEFMINCGSDFTGINETFKKLTKAKN